MAGDRDNQLILGAFLQAANCSNYAASWRHPASDPGFLTARFYQEIARTLEAGKFHFGFIDDRLAMPSRFNDSVDDTVRLGIRAVKLDLVPVVMAMSLATRYLGVSATYSTTYHAPFHIARLFSTIDHLTAGRAAWNVVTSLNDSEAQNFGVESHADHDTRYEQADEVMEIITGLWDSWDDGALLLDKLEGVFADPASVHRLDYEGKWFSSRGPLTVPRSPQGYPVVMQAGQSDRGREFAARWAEVVFAVFRDIQSGQNICGDIKGRAATYGRDPDHVKVVTAAYAIVGETGSMAREKLEYIESLAHPSDTPVLLSELLNYDFGQHSPDERLADSHLDAISGSRGMAERMRKSGDDYPTFGDLLKQSGRGTIWELPVFVGTPAQVADEMEEWYRQEACDGFMIAAPYLPGAYQDFARMVVPELQRRGVFHHDYGADTLRGNLGLPRP